MPSRAHRRIHNAKHVSRLFTRTWKYRVKDDPYGWKNRIEKNNRCHYTPENEERTQRSGASMQSFARSTPANYHRFNWEMHRNNIQVTFVIFCKKEINKFNFVLSIFR